VSICARLIALLVAGLLVASAVAACGDDEETETVTEVSEPAGEATGTTGTNQFGEADVEAARLALEGVINRDIKDPAYHVEDFRSDPAVSPDLIAQINQLEDEARAEGLTGLDFDPFLCAQNTPTGVTLNEAGTAADRVTFVGVFDFGGQREKVTYVVARTSGGQWQLDSTECLDAALPRGE
jgi:hypothetical protein